MIANFFLHLLEFLCICSCWYKTKPPDAKPLFKTSHWEFCFYNNPLSSWPNPVNMNSKNLEKSGLSEKPACVMSCPKLSFYSYLHLFVHSHRLCGSSLEKLSNYFSTSFPPENVIFSAVWSEKYTQGHRANKCHLGLLNNDMIFWHLKNHFLCSCLQQVKLVPFPQGHFSDHTAKEIVFSARKLMEK